jgi:hypothetical protein
MSLEQKRYLERMKAASLQQDKVFNYSAQHMKNKQPEKEKYAKRIEQKLEEEDRKF